MDTASMPKAAPQKHDSVSALALEKIRPERNLEKWSIWQPANSRAATQERVLTREITLPNGDRVTAQVEIVSTTKGALTTEDQRTYYGLVKYWEQNGRTSTTYFSLKQLSKLLNKKWGTRTVETLTESLARLYVSSFFWKNAYHDNSTGKTHESIEGFRILDNLKIVRTKTDGHITKAQGYFKFNEFILNNLQSNHTKPVLFEVVLGFKSEIAQIIYTHVDLILNDKPIYERRSKELFEDLSISGKEYVYPSARKRVLDKALKELAGKQISSGGIIAAATVEKTKDGKDYKVVFRKGSAPKVQDNVDATPTQSEGGSEQKGQSYAPQPTDAEQKGEELLRYFHKVFFGLEATATRSRHRDLATALIAQHGWEVAAYIVDFSHTAAQETNFKIATFGGITQYVDRAVADYHDRKREQERRQQGEAEAAELRRRERTAAAARQRAQERYDQLPEAERQALTDTYTAKLCAEIPMWAEAKEKGGYSLLTAAVRSAILEDFAAAERGEGREAPATPHE